MSKDDQMSEQCNESAKVKDLSVKGIPEQVWFKARFNAMKSHMSFKEYIVKILEDCPVFKSDETA
jgi:hypothetical protein